MTLDPAIQHIIQDALQEVRSFDPPWSDSDIFHSACGAALKYAHAHGQESTPELHAAIQAAVREEMANS